MFDKEKSVDKGKTKEKGFWAAIGAGTTVASLCCLTPLVLVMFGLSTVSFASSLADTLYGSYKWVFRIAGLLFLGLALILYFRSRGICTFDQAKRQRNEILNKVLIAVIAGIVAYIIFLYVIVHYAGVWLGIWQ